MESYAMIVFHTSSYGFLSLFMMAFHMSLYGFISDAWFIAIAYYIISYELIWSHIIYNGGKPYEFIWIPIIAYNGFYMSSNRFLSYTMTGNHMSSNDIVSLHM